MSEETRQAAHQFLTPSDCSRLANGQITPSGIKAAAARKRLRVAAVTAGGMHLFERGDVEEFLATRKPPKRKAA